ncbi:MAG: phycobiliprotein lyase [Microcystaceae cyanobacterium]
MNAMEFFEKSAGQWRSQRTTHHLAFRRAESGTSDIWVESLQATDPRIIEICEMHDVSPDLAVGGAFVRWESEMAWDKEDENHAGTTVFALVPDADDPHKGTLLRERGYAEIVPIAGRYHIDEDEALVLVTEYETMTTIERFWFAQPHIRLRTSTVQRFGGFNTATFCTEMRADQPPTTAESPAEMTYGHMTGW